VKRRVASEASQHHVNDSGINHGLAVLRQDFLVFAEAAIVAEPRKRSFNDPASGKKHAAMVIIGAFHDRKEPASAGENPVDQGLPLLPTSGPDERQAFKAFLFGPLAEGLRPSPFLDTGFMHENDQA